MTVQVWAGASDGGLLTWMCEAAVSDVCEAAARRRLHSADASVEQQQRSFAQPVLHVLQRSVAALKSDRDFISSMLAEVVSID